jgi:glycosyltransferase involved in cell wall biosynthesis
MGLVIIANDWAAGEKNPTSKHRIALELVRLGHRVLWIEGSGMRTPSFGSGSDRGRIVAKLARAWRGAVRSEVGGQRSERAGLTSDFGPSMPDLGSIWVLSPLFIPLPRYAWIRRANGWICRTSARRWSRRLAFDSPVVINYVPVLADALRGWRGRKVYHCVDRWDAFAMYDRDVMARADEECCRRADVVIASSSDLAERCRRFNANVHLVTHGVDHDHFARALTGLARPADLPPGPVVGFFGLISEWVDQDLLIKLAQSLAEGGRRAGTDEDNQELRKRRTGDRQSETASHTQPCPPPNVGGVLRTPISGQGNAQQRLNHEEHEGSEVGGREIEASVVLIGAADVDVTRLKACANIHLLGPRPFADLPSYVAHFSAGIIPFAVNGLTRAVNPIKLREMLSAGCPVVSTALPEVERYAAVEDGRGECRGVGVSGCRGEEDGGERGSSTTKCTKDTKADVRGGWPRSVRIGRSHDEFIEQVRAVLCRPPEQAARREISERMAGETWEAKVEEMLGSMGVLGCRGDRRSENASHIPAPCPE